MFYPLDCLFVPVHSFLSCLHIQVSRSLAQPESFLDETNSDLYAVIIRWVVWREIQLDDVEPESNLSEFALEDYTLVVIYAQNMICLIWINYRGLWSFANISVCSLQLGWHMVSIYNKDVTTCLETQGSNCVSIEDICLQHLLNIQNKEEMCTERMGSWSLSSLMLRKFYLHAVKQSSRGEANKAFLRVLKYSSGAVLEVCFLY